MPWSFYASLWVVSITYSSDLNSTHWETRETVEVDDCAPLSINTPGYALWLALVPAVACAVQLPGSVLFPGRSNLYRLSPELGLADALATLGLVVRALWEGYKWREAVVAVLVVREGLGRADPWWRRDCLADVESSPYEEADCGGSDSSAVDMSTGSSPPRSSAEPFDHRIQKRISQHARSLTIERALGVLLFSVALIKAITALSTPGAASAAVSIPAVLAVGYSSSFVILEALVWSLSIPTAGYSVADIPQQNLLEVLRFVDPGGDPFSPPIKTTEASTTQDPVLELGPVSHTDQTLAPTQHATRASRDTRVMFWASLAAVCTCLGWAVLLYNIWRFSRAVVATSAVCVLAVLGSHLVASALRALVPSRSCLPVQARNSWFGRNVTVVSVLPWLWIVTICTYIVLAFPEESPDGGYDLLQKPAWLDWLG